MKTLPVIPLVAATLLTFACGGSSEPTVLHLRGFDGTPEQYRVGFQKLAVNDPVGVREVCSSLKGLNAEQAREALRPTESSTEPVAQEYLAAGVTPVPGQKPNESDAVVAAGIVLEECGRLAG